MKRKNTKDSHGREICGKCGLLVGLGRDGERCECFTPHPKEKRGEAGQKGGE